MIADIGPVPDEEREAADDEPKNLKQLMKKLKEKKGKKTKRS